MPKSVLRFTEDEKHRAAAAIFKLRHPNFTYKPVTDYWAYRLASAALAAVEGQAE